MTQLTIKKRKKYLLESESEMKDYYYLNLGALSANYIVSDKEDFKEIYTILRDVADKMIGNLVPYVFSMNIYYAATQNKDIVMGSILLGIPNPDEIINDKEMGISSIESLTKWILALQGGSNSKSYAELKNHFKLNDDQMQQIIGPNSFIKALYSATQVSYALRYEWKKFWDNTTMFAIQWASQNITNDSSTFISPNVIPVPSLFNLSESLFGTPPEFSYAIKQLKLGFEAENLNLTQSLALASISSFIDSASIFNPRNLYDFFVSYQNKRYENILIKFKLVSIKQADAIYKYLMDYVIPKLGNYVDKKGTKQHKSFARLITYTFNKTDEYLRKFLPDEMYSRYIAASLIRDKKLCKDFVGKVVKDEERLNHACSDSDFTTLIGSQPWSIAYYRGKSSDMYVALKHATNLTLQEMDSIFSTSNPESLGSYCLNIITDVSKGYKCADNPWSRAEIAHKQFMNTTMTMEIIEQYKGITEFLQPVDSVTKWDYPDNVPLEFDYYSEKKCHDEKGLTEEAFQAITSGPYSLSSYTNAINFVIDLDHGDNIAEYTEKYKTNSTSLFWALRYMTQDALLGGLFVKNTPEERIFGYVEPKITMLREGNFTLGSDPSAQDYISINDIYYNSTLINTTNVEIYTGNRHPQKVKTARSINYGVYLNNIVYFYNGTGIETGHLNPFHDNFDVSGTDGLQFGKEISSNDDLYIFDQRKIQNMKYKFVKKSTYEQKNIKTYIYDLDYSSLTKDYKDNKLKNYYYDGFVNVSSNFKMPLASSPGYFHLCKEEDYGKVTIDDKKPTELSGDVNNWMSVEPVTGFTIESHKNEMLSINVHEKYLAFPDLDNIKGFIPIMNVEGEIYMNQDVFMNKYGFVNSYTYLIFYFRVIGYPIAAASMICVAITFLMLRCRKGEQFRKFEPNYEKLEEEKEDHDERRFKFASGSVRNGNNSKYKTQTNGIVFLYIKF